MNIEPRLLDSRTAPCRSLTYASRTTGGAAGAWSGWLAHRNGTALEELWSCIKHIRALGPDRACCDRGLDANRANAAASTTGRHVLAGRRPNARDGAGRERHPSLPRYAASQRRAVRAAAPLPAARIQPRPVRGTRRFDRRRARSAFPRRSSSVRGSSRSAAGSGPTRRAAACNSPGRRCDTNSRASSACRPRSRTSCSG